MPRAKVIDKLRRDKLEGKHWKSKKKKRIEEARKR